MILDSDAPDKVEVIEEMIRRGQTQGDYVCQNRSGYNLSRRPGACRRVFQT